MFRRYIVVFVFVCFAKQVVYSVPAIPKPFKHRLPNGSSISIRLHGDEWFHWHTTPDGYTLLFTPEGFLEYAVSDSSAGLRLSGIRAHDEAERTDAEKHLLAHLPKKLRYSSSQISAIREIQGFREKEMRKLSQKSSGQAPDTVRAPLMLVEFADKTFSKSKSDFEMLCNQSNYTAGGSMGSVRDYFYTASYGKLVFLVDVFGPYRLNNPIIYYDQKSGGRPVAMAEEAARAADLDCDFSKYDLDEDGYMDMLYLIFAGNDQAAGAPIGESLWAHASSIDDELILDGKRILSYACSGELRDSDGTGITYIGTICHEMSHVFGLPDLYDTDGNFSDGVSVDIGQWDIMAYGSWNDEGRTPALHSAWSRIALGWMPVETLEAAANLSLPNPNETGIAYRINTSTADEYFLLENRQKQGWDAYIPGSGLLIYHVDENFGGWASNCVNCNPNHRGLYVKQAGCSDSEGCASNRSTDPFPQNNQTDFTDETTPSSKSWNGQNTGKPITEIAHNPSEGSVFFKFKGGNLQAPDVKIEELLSPQPIVYGEGQLDIKVKLKNTGSPLTSAAIAWSVNGEEQQAYPWQGTLNTGESTILTLGTMTFAEGRHQIQISATSSTDPNPTNNTIEKTIKVVRPIFIEDFEKTTSEWFFSNGSQPNRWIVDSATSCEGLLSAYISNNNEANAYTTSIPGAVHLYRDILLPKSETDFELYFDFKGMGDVYEGEIFDYLEVRVLETNMAATAGHQLSAGTFIGKYHSQDNWATFIERLPAKSFSEKNIRLVFSWYNDGADGQQPPAAIDRIVIAYSLDTLLLFEDFENSVNNDLPSGWTRTTPDDGNFWGTDPVSFDNENNLQGSFIAYEGTRYANIRFHETRAHNAWMFTPETNLLPDKPYTLSFYINMQDLYGYEYLTVGIGQGADAAAMYDTLFFYRTETFLNWTKVSSTFTVPEAGSYNIGFHASTPANRWYIAVDNLELFTTKSETHPDTSTRLQPHIPTEDIPLLTAWIADNSLNISGLQKGEVWQIFTVSGHLIHQAIATSDSETLPVEILKKQGMYIIRQKNIALKIIY